MSGVRSTPSAQSPLAFLPLHAGVIGALLLVVAVVIHERFYEPRTAAAGIAIACGFAVLALIVYARVGLGFPWLSASVVYLALFWMFHYGLTFTSTFVPDVLATYQDWELAWMQWPNVRLAMLLGVIGAAGFVFGAGVTKGSGPLAEPGTPAHNPALFIVGWGVMLTGMVMTVVTLAMNGGVGLFSMSYMELRGTVLAGVQSLLDITQIGCLFALCGAGGRRWVAPLVVFSMFASVLLVAGFRTEALVPMVSFFIVLAHRGVRFRRSTLIAATLAAAAIIPMVKVIRTVGVANNANVNWSEVSPLETFTELGGTLRAVKSYVDWIEQGDSLLWGSTYWAPFDRQLVSQLMPSRERVPYEKDERLPERNINREGSIGLAATGEAYYNFGLVGPFIYFGFVGALFGWLERRAPTTPFHCAALGIAMSVFYFNIRGSWLSLPANFGAALVLLVICYVLSEHWMPASRDNRRALARVGPSLGHL